MRIEDPKKRQILEFRARLLARPVGGDEEPGGRLETVQFTLAGERYAVAAEYVREAVPLKDFSPVPCTPAFVLGMINVRGQILTLLDIRRLFDLPHGSLSELNQVLILRDGDVEFGIVTDAILGMEAISLEDFQTTVPALSGTQSHLFRGVRADCLILLDAQKLLSSEAIIVHEEAPLSSFSKRNSYRE